MSDKHRPGLAGAIIAVIGKRWPTVNEQRYIERNATSEERDEYERRLQQTRKEQGQ